MTVTIDISTNEAQFLIDLLIRHAATAVMKNDKDNAVYLTALAEKIQDSVSAQTAGTAA